MFKAILLVGVLNLCINHLGALGDQTLLGVQDGKLKHPIPMVGRRLAFLCKETM